MAEWLKAPLIHFNVRPWIKITPKLFFPANHIMCKQLSSNRNVVFCFFFVLDSLRFLSQYLCLVEVTSAEKSEKQPENVKLYLGKLITLIDL